MVRKKQESGGRRALDAGRKLVWMPLEPQVFQDFSDLAEKFGWSKSMLAQRLAAEAVRRFRAGETIFPKIRIKP